MREIAPGIEHWVTVHPSIHQPVSSYRLVAERVLIDPLVPPDGLGALAGPTPTDVLMTNRHHWRGCTKLIEAFGVRAHAPRSGMHELGADRPAAPYDPGDELPGGAIVHEVGVLCPDEMALWLPAHGALAIADGTIRHPPDGPLGFVPDELLGDDPAGIRDGLRERYRALADLLRPEVLLLAHGEPLTSGATQALLELARAGRSVRF